MVLYEVIIAPKAISQLDDYVGYVYYTLLNPIAAESILRDAEETRKTLEKVAGSLKLCDHPKL